MSTSVSCSASSSPLFSSAVSATVHVQHQSKRKHHHDSSPTAATMSHKKVAYSTINNHDILSSHTSSIPNAHTSSSSCFIASAPSSTLPIDYHTHALELQREGYTVMPFLSAVELDSYISLLHSTLSCAPELCAAGASTSMHWTYGGFGALGLASSFHNTVVRQIRSKCMKQFATLANTWKQIQHQNNTSLSSSSSSPLFVQQMFDRVCIRRVGSSTTAESWHQDLWPLPNSSDLTFGGWINLDSHSSPFGATPQDISLAQTFSVLPRSRAKIQDDCKQTNTSGFVKLSAEQISRLNPDVNKRAVSILPGQWLIFDSRLLHEICSYRTPRVSLRLFTGFRLTTQPTSMWDPHTNSALKQSKEFKELIKNVAEFNFAKHVIDAQGIAPLPSGQWPPNYAKMNAVFHRAAVIEWSRNTFQPVCLVACKPPRSSSNDASSDTVTDSASNSMMVHRFMPSLQQLQLPKYAEYTAMERRMMEQATSLSEWIDI